MYRTCVIWSLLQCEHASSHNQLYIITLFTVVTSGGVGEFVKVWGRNNSRKPRAMRGDWGFGWGLGKGTPHAPVRYGETGAWKCLLYDYLPFII